MPAPLYENHLKGEYAVERGDAVLIITARSCYTVAPEAAWLVAELPGAGTLETYREGPRRSRPRRARNDPRSARRHRRPAAEAPRRDRRKAGPRAADAEPPPDPRTVAGERAARARAAPVGTMAGRRARPASPPAGGIVRRNRGLRAEPVRGAGADVRRAAERRRDRPAAARRQPRPRNGALPDRRGVRDRPAADRVFPVPLLPGLLRQRIGYGDPAASPQDRDRLRRFRLSVRISAGARRRVVGSPRHHAPGINPLDAAGHGLQPEPAAAHRRLLAVSGPARRPAPQTGLPTRSTSSTWRPFPASPSSSCTGSSKGSARSFPSSPPDWSAPRSS